MTATRHRAFLFPISLRLVRNAVHFWICARELRHLGRIVGGGKPALCLMQPEYATASCLSSHGSPKGERDIAGMRKEGWKEGELAGATSVTMPLH